VLRCRSSAKDVAPGSNGATERPCGQQLRGRPSAIDNSSNDVNLAQSTGCINGNEYLIPPPYLGESAGGVLRPGREM
jgi:hypothetical protein